MRLRAISLKDDGDDQPMAVVDLSRDDFLVVSAYAKRTIANYSRAVKLFMQWLLVPANDVRLSTFDDIDAALFRYLHHLYRSGAGKALAANTLYGLCLEIPRVKPFLLSSRLALRGFTKLSPSTPWKPVPWHVTLVIACWLARFKRAKYGLAVLLCFDCYLRVGELINLRFNDFAYGNDDRYDDLNGNMIVRLRRTKTGPLKGTTVSDRHVKGLMKAYLESINRGGNSHIFGFSADQFRRALAKACSALHLPHYTPHSLRHGSASRDFINGVGIEDIMVKGRWKSNDSARHYIQQSRQLLMAEHIPPKVATKGKFIRDDLCGWFRYYVGLSLCD